MHNQAQQLIPIGVYEADMNALKRRLAGVFWTGLKGGAHVKRTEPTNLTSLGTSRVLHPFPTRHVFSITKASSEEETLFHFILRQQDNLCDVYFILFKILYTRTVCHWLLKECVLLLRLHTLNSCLLTSLEECLQILFIFYFILF